MGACRPTAATRVDRHAGRADALVRPFNNRYIFDASRTGVVDAGMSRTSEKKRVNDNVRVHTDHSRVNETQRAVHAPRNPF
jgi:hypothetical protein